MLPVSVDLEFQVLTSQNSNPSDQLSVELLCVILREIKECIKYVTAQACCGSCTEIYFCLLLPQSREVRLVTQACLKWQATTKMSCGLRATNRGTTAKKVEETSSYCCNC
jgi:hypothetical protein